MKQELGPEHGMAGITAHAEQSGEPTRQPSRRGMLRIVFGVAAALAGTGTAFASQTGSAKADDGTIIGVTGVSSNGTGVLGIGATNGVHGKGTTVTAIGVWGDSAAGTGVFGSSTDHVGVFGASTSWYGVNGFSSESAGVHGQSNDAAGVFGESSSGRGGVFTGKVAALRLVSAAIATHPDSGLMGDLFVDSAGGLWYCRGGTDWAQLA